MSLHEAACLVSMFLTAPTIVFSFGVAIQFSREGLTAFGKQRNRRTREEWLILGILVGFVSKILDNLYWAIPWSLQFIGHSDAGWWHHNGVYPNIFSRQFLAWNASFLHLYSIAVLAKAMTTPNELSPVSQVYKKQIRFIRNLVTISIVLGAVYVSVLLYLKHV